MAYYGIKYNKKEKKRENIWELNQQEYMHIGYKAFRRKTKE